MDKSKPMLMSILILLVLVLGAVAGLFLYTMRSGKADASAPAGQAPAPRLNVDQITKVPLSTVSTNLRQGSGGARDYVKLTLQVGVSNTAKKESEAVVKSINDNEAVALDVVNGVLRNKTRDELADPDLNTLQDLKDEIASKLRDAFNTNLIVDVYVAEIAY
ncbi:MAG: flagellar basal body-associated FliL family protein [Firmicutes bacterium]|nr:flagellar basal body-associated FliL family protein [Bacillota bacterium]